MVNLLTDLGEEYWNKNGLEGVSIDIGLYNDSTDGITDSDDLSAITTEPSGTSYARQTDTFSVVDISGDWGIQNDSSLSFDVSDSTQTVDAFFLVITFTASDTGDSGDNDHLVACGDLTQSRDLSQIDFLDVNANDIQVTLT